MSSKTLAVIAYITPIGWIIALVQYYKQDKSPLLRFHLKQALGLMLSALLLAIITGIIAYTVPALGLLYYANAGILLLVVLGMINAANEAEKALPLLGKLADDKLDFL